LIVNRSIPGQMTDSELLRLCELARAVPPDGVIVEVGSLYGLSSWHLAKNCAPGVTIFCIDPWKREPWIINLVEIPQKAPPFDRAAFEKYTADCDNIVMVQGYSPHVAKGWKLPIDLYVEDAMHINPILAANINFWSARVRPGGVVSGHDYCAEWPDVKREADAVAQREGSRVELVDTYWSVRKPNSRRL
jgi:Methyltransferase domain